MKNSRELGPLQHSIVTTIAVHAPNSFMDCKCLANLIAEHLEVHHPLSNTQWGFQAGKSTTGALLSTTYEWLTALENGSKVCAVFFDLKKAFDSVPHKELMSS